MEIEIAMKRLHDSDINCSVRGFDSWWDVRLGDRVNGFVAAANFGTLSECADFLDRKAKKHFPESSYAVGKLDLEQRDGMQFEPHSC